MRYLRFLGAGANHLPLRSLRKEETNNARSLDICYQIGNNVFVPRSRTILERNKTEHADVG